MSDDIPIVGSPAASFNPTPVCPYCLQDPATFNARGPVRVSDNLMGVIIYCGNLECRKIWSFDVLPVAQPSRIQTPIFVPPS